MSYFYLLSISCNYHTSSVTEAIVNHRTHIFKLPLCHQLPARKEWYLYELLMDFSYQHLLLLIGHRFPFIPVNVIIILSILWWDCSWVLMWNGYWFHQWLKVWNCWWCDWWVFGWNCSWFLFILGKWSRPSGPKPEIQHDQRGRGVPTLTWEEVSTREGKRRCYCCTKKEIIRLRNDFKLALNWRVKKGVYRVESYTIPCATLKRLRWRTSPAEKEATYYRGVNVQSNHWTGSILGSSLYDLIDQHWFLQRYLVMCKVSFRNEVATSVGTATSALTSAGCQPHTSSIRPWSDVPKVSLYGT